MKITSLDRNMKQVLETGYYSIPRFQRPFSWEKDQVEEFWSDTITGESDYFIGSMVVYTEREGVFGIVDGQQRLTTITMILCALRNAFSAERFAEEARGVHQLVERRNIDNKPEYVIQSESSYPYFQEHIQKFEAPEVAVTAGQEEELLKTAFDIIRGNISDIVSSIKEDPTLSEEAKQEKVLQKLVEVRGRVLGLKVIYITLDNEIDAYEIFETLNTRGRDLNQGDLVKSHLTRLIKPKNARVDLTKDKWHQITKRIEDCEVPIDVFLYHHWLSKRERYVPAKKLFKSIKHQIKTNNAKEFLDDLDKDSKLYYQIMKPTLFKWKRNERPIQESLRALAIFRVKQPIPMLLSVMRDYRAGRLRPKHTQEVLEAIENFHFAFSAVTSQRSSGGISSMYTGHAIDLVNSKTYEEQLAVLNSLKTELLRKRPAYPEFEVDFSQIGYMDGQDKHKRLVQYILSKIDSQFQRGIPVDYEQMTIEHIAPQNPKEGPILSPELVAQLGNLLLVGPDLNGQLANKPFHKKKKILDASNAWQDDILKQATEWGESEIKNRTKYLATLAYEKVWRIC